MAKTFRYKHLLSSTANNVPASDKLLKGEIAINDLDEKLFIKNNGGEIVTFIPESQINAKINALDKAASAEDGKVVTTVSETNGVVSETKAKVKDLQLGGYSKDTTATGAIGSTDTINTALSKLENTVAANEISNSDHSITVTTASTGTDIAVNIKTGEKVIKLGNDGIYTDIKISALTATEIGELPGSTNIKEAYKLLDSDGNKLGDVIKIYKDSSLYNAYLGHMDDSITSSTDPTVVPGTGDTALCFIYQKADGTYELVKVDVSRFLEEAEFLDGLTVNNHVVKVLIDPTSETFLTVSSNGVKLSGVQNAINTAIQALDVTADTAQAGQYVAAIKETDGLVAVKTRANVSEAVLNNYVKGTDGSDVAATDTLNQAISKLENQISIASSAATSKVEKDANASHLTVTSTTGADNSVTYTIGENDIASNSDLTAEIAARKAVDGQTGQTYVANGSTNYIGDATSLNDADVKLDAAIKANNDRAISAENTLQSELDTTQTGAGLNTDGTYTANTSSNYLTGATSLADADNKLDTKLFELSGAVKNAVEGLDYTDTDVTNQWVTKVDEANGVIVPARSYISVTNLTTNGDPDFTVDGTTGEIILEAGTF
jgi:hypothetical protein